MSGSEEAASSSDSSETRATGRFPIFRRLIRWLFVGVLVLVMLGMLCWSALAIYIADTHSGPRTIRAVLIVLVSIATLFIRPRRYGLLAFALLFFVVLGWFFSLKASNDRDWAPDVARVAWAQIDGDRMTIHNVRHFDYRSETDFTPHWEDRVYDLSRLKSFDFMLVYWGSPSIAHAMVSFDFDDGQYLCVSIETRKEKSESYSTVQGFFRQFELIYIVADERDLIRLRTNYRNEDVYLYRSNATPSQVRNVLMSYVSGMNELNDHPAFYNALSSNCATTVVTRVQDAGVPAKMSWEILLSGYAARQAYANGRLDTSLPFEELQKRSHINETARGAGNGPDFSKKIRAGLPNPAKVAAEMSAKSSPPATRSAK
jgi:hypothetical protein